MIGASGEPRGHFGAEAPPPPKKKKYIFNIKLYVVIAKLVVLVI